MIDIQNHIRNRNALNLLDRVQPVKWDIYADRCSWCGCSGLQIAQQDGKCDCPDETWKRRYSGYDVLDVSAALTGRR